MQRSVFLDQLERAVCRTAFPSSYHRFIRTTNGLERVFREVKRRTRVVEGFLSEERAETLATAMLLQISEDWSERRYLGESKWYCRAIPVQ
jgi:transposase-like protein